MNPETIGDRMESFEALFLVEFEKRGEPFHRKAFLRDVLVRGAQSEFALGADLTRTLVELVVSLWLAQNRGMNFMVLS